MSTRKFAIANLSAIENKNKSYFTENNLKIMDCVTVIGARLVSVHITNQSLPFNIRFQIESLFWRE